MPTRRIAIEFDADVGTARALARALHQILLSVDVEHASTTVDGFQMLAKDGWHGDYRISIDPA